MYCIFLDVWCTGVHLYCTVYCSVLYYFFLQMCGVQVSTCTVLYTVLYYFFLQMCGVWVSTCTVLYYFFTDVWCTGVHLYCTVLLFLQMCGVRVSTCTVLYYFFYRCVVYGCPPVYGTSQAVPQIPNILGNLIRRLNREGGGGLRRD